jgi:hypothetical protein
MPFVGQRLHHAPQILAADRVDAHAGLVQQQHLGPRHQRTGKAQLLLHAAGELAGQAFGKGGKPREVQQLGKQIGVASASMPRNCAYRRMFSITDRSSYRPKRCGM